LEKQDWRLQGQERYLQGVTLRRSGYAAECRSNDHDHCEFWQAKFMVGGTDGALSEGYCTLDRYRWICCGCFHDFRERFNWQLAS
jgi:hypothetical protein